MTPREQFLAILNYETLDAPLLMQWMGFSEATLHRWHREGLPQGVDIDDYLGLAQVRSLPVTVFPYPPREDIELSRTGTRRIVLDNRDLQVLWDTEAPYFPKYLGYPVRTRADWTRYVERLNTDSDARYDALRQAAASLRESDAPVILGLRGCWEIRYFLGMTEALTMLHDDPHFLVEMLDTWFTHQWQILDRVCEYVLPDAICLWEDLAYKNGPFVSPEMYRTYFARYHAETARRLHAHGIRHFLVDCDGNIDLLLPLFLDNGITGVYPLERQSEADPLKFRRQYGKRVQLIGGIDKRALIRGRETAQEAVTRTLLPLLPDGGYLPGIDHAVPPEVSFDTFRYYLDCLRDAWEQIFQ